MFPTNIQKQQEILIFVFFRKEIEISLLAQLADMNQVS